MHELWNLLDARKRKVAAARAAERDRALARAPRTPDDWARMGVCWVNLGALEDFAGRLPKRGTS